MATASTFVAQDRDSPTVIKEIQCKAKCSAKSTTEEDQLSELETLAIDGDESREDEKVEQPQSSLATTEHQ